MTKYRWVVGQTYRTVNGYEAKLVACVNNDHFPLLFVLTKTDGKQVPVRRNDQGILPWAGPTYQCNIVPPEPVKTSRFITTYDIARNNPHLIGGTYHSLEQARRWALPSRLKAILELQYEDDDLVNVVIHPAKKGKSK